MSWINGPLLGFDTETTGTNTDTDRIVTAALVFSTGPGRAGETVATWLIDPGVEIPEAAARVHGISTAHAQQYGVPSRPALEEIAARLTEALQQGTPIVAFNGSFDLRIIEAELTRHDLPTLADRLGHDIAPVIDPLVLDRGLDRFRKGKRTLSAVMEHYGVQADGTMHTADVDVSMTLDVLRAMAEKFPEVGGTELPELHKKQIELHRAWAENFNEFLKKKGKTPDASTTWPL
ncbi:exonuclease domain-containing protein [Helcobacillus massiliensis]|uniref:DNA polymerase-3 subunit epsilon n=1 Tax=Helcobacillus massiliensis TaxID=521392 RepID=A0A839QW41_9MICO|nr:exonuclease domain-containing protein [Helcobacillus massiliensis]MBB3023069.1 DNA polymerase-3 subunit epsilon [Helcobacillus massiliensis]